MLWQDDSQWYGKLLRIPKQFFLLVVVKYIFSLLKIPIHQYEALKKAKWHDNPDDIPKIIGDTAVVYNHIGPSLQKDL